MTERGENQKHFEASKYLSRLQGKDYLEVKWRLLWLRTEHPEAHIETELVKHEDGFALFRAMVEIPEGGSATGWGSETSGDFRDFIEKAETKALGRALAALGYGTQFCEDFDFATPHNGHVVDSPIDTPIRRTAAVAAAAPRPTQATSNVATPAQLRAIYTIARDQYAMSEHNVAERSMSSYGCSPQELTKQQASDFISALKNNTVRVSQN
jgi:uncharacterized protein YbdZ (MbtH family)